MKVQKAEFKAIIKECLKELVSEGALDHMISGVVTERSQAIQQQNLLQDPRIKMAAGGNPIMEQVFADTALNSMQPQQPSMPYGLNPDMVGQSFNPMMMQPQQQQMMVPQGRNPLPPRDPQAVAALQAAVTTHVQQQQPMSNWARLAFNKPISNRPAQSGGGFGGGGHLPGAKKGSFE
jgi:hypothetical protein